MTALEVIMAIAMVLMSIFLVELIVIGIVQGIKAILRRKKEQ